MEQFSRFPCPTLRITYHFLGVTSSKLINETKKTGGDDDFKVLMKDENDASKVQDDDVEENSDEYVDCDEVIAFHAERGRAGYYSIVKQSTCRITALKRLISG